MQIALGHRERLSKDPSDQEWRWLFQECQKQAVAAFVFPAIERLAAAGQKPPVDLVYEWIGHAQVIESQNRILNKKCVNVVSEYESAGFRCVVLKGQGNATMYPNPLLRMPGDIDVWIRTMSEDRCIKEDVIRYAKKQDIKAEIRYYHVGYMDDGVTVEAHFIPGIMNNPIYNHRLQAFYREMAEKRKTDVVALPDGVGRIPVPSWEFNLVFQLAHMMHHFFDEGIGLRQIVDYYFLLSSRAQSRDLSTLVEMTKEAQDDISHETSSILKHLNLYKFAGAVMYVLKEALGMEERYLIVPVDERRGKTLLREIMEGGNFGRSEGRWKMSDGRGKKYFVKIWRNLHFVREYPAEALCEPFFRTWHYFWRLGR